MTNKSITKVTQHLKYGGKKGKIDSFEMEQELKNYQNPSIKSKDSLKKLNKNNEDIIYQEKVFKCDICYETFKKNQNLKHHIQSVHEGKTFKCDICPSTFADQSYLN